MVCSRCGLVGAGVRPEWSPHTNKPPPGSQGRRLELMANWPGWSAKLSRAIELRNGTKFLTLADVRDFILDQPEHIQERSFWQHAARSC